MWRRWQRCRAFWRDEQGGNLVEYALLAAIVSTIAIGSMIAIGAQVDVFFTSAIAF